MRPDPLLQFRLGLAAIAILVAAILTGIFAPQLFDRRHPAFAVFENVAELTEGAPIRDQGFLIGRVTHIHQDLKHKRFIVEVRLDPDWDKNEDQLHAIGLVIDQPNPLRAAALSVVDAPSHAADCPDRRFEPELQGPQMVGCGHHLSLVEQASLVLNKANDAIGQVAGMLKSAAPQEAGSVSQQGAASASMMTKLNATLDNVQALTLSARTVLNGQNQKEIGAIIHNLAAVSKTATTTAAQVNTLVQKNAEPAGAAVSDMRYILAVTATSMASIASNLQATSENLKEVSSALRENPSAAVRGRDLGDPALVREKSK